MDYLYRVFLDLLAGVVGYVGIGVIFNSSEEFSEYAKRVGLPSNILEIWGMSKKLSNTSSPNPGVQDLKKQWRFILIKRLFIGGALFLLSYFLFKEAGLSSMLTDI